MHNIEIYKDNIIHANVDAIVNAANPKMLGGGGVDGAIHLAAGPTLLASCQAVQAQDGIRCPFGEARITGAGKLSAKYIIHTVGPKYPLEKEPEKLLRSAYEKTMDLALTHKCSSIAFPAISCGAYGYPGKEASEVALMACANPKYKDITIMFYLFTEELHQIWLNTLELMKHQLNQTPYSFNQSA